MWERVKLANIVIIITIVSSSLLVKISANTNLDGTLKETIYYTSQRPIDWDLFLFETPKAKPIRLTSDPILDYDPVFSFDGRWIVLCSERRGNPDLYALDLKNGGELHLLINSNAMEDQPTISPDGRFIAFVSTRDGNADIFIIPFHPERLVTMDEAVNITNHPGGDFRPSFSPDGKKIAFSSDRDSTKFGLKSRTSEIYVMQTDGSNIKRLTEATGWDGSPCWSLDGTNIFFYSERDGNFRIWRMNADGSQQTPISAIAVKALSPTVSRNNRVAFIAINKDQASILSIAPDGSDQKNETDIESDYRGIAFDPKSDRMVCYGKGPVDKTTGIASSLTNIPFLAAGGQKEEIPDRLIELRALHTLFPAINPRGDEVVSSIEMDNNSLLISTRLDGGGVRRIFKPTNGPVWDARWSVDGKWLIFCSGPIFEKKDKSVDIWKMRSDGSEVINLTNNKANNGCADFSPNNKQIVFRSWHNDNHEIYLMNADGSNPQLLTDNPANDTMPAFSPKGNEIAFCSTRDGNYEVYTMQINENGSPGQLRRITNHPGEDSHPRYSPDGKWLVINSEKSGLNDEEPLNPLSNLRSYGEIWVIRLEDLKEIRLTHDKWQDGLAVWGKTRN